MPGVMTILGISNVSFGLNPVARKIVGAVFLYHAVELGWAWLSSIHRVMPFAEFRRSSASWPKDLVLARRDDALHG